MRGRPVPSKSASSSTARPPGGKAFSWRKEIFRPKVIWIRERIALSPGTISDDPQIKIRRISPLLAKEESDYRATPESWHFRNTGSSGKARTRCAVFQTRRRRTLGDGKADILWQNACGFSARRDNIRRAKRSVPA